jgi:phosphopantetheinyl transferase
MTQVFVLPYEWVVQSVSPDRVVEILPENELMKANRFIHKADRDRFLAARLFLFGLLKQQGLLKSNELKLDYNDFGKPCLKEVEIEFNWSHSGDMIAIILGMDQCGIDIELHSGKELYDYRSLCTERELQIISQRSQQTGIPEHEQFLDFWTAKESVLKAKGTGLSTDPRLIEIIFRHFDENSWICKYERIVYGRTEAINWRDKKYSIAWCTPINNLIYPIKEFDMIDEILIYI